MVLNQDPLQGLNHRLLDLIFPPPKASDSVGRGWGLRTYISNTFLGDADVTRPGTTLLRRTALGN